MKRYAAKLLFQFPIDEIEDSRKRRICEQRIICLNAKTARTALHQAKRNGERNQYQYQNSDGATVHFDFVGVMELLHLGIECKAEEVWYDIVEYQRPMERKETFIPPETELNAIRNESENAGLEGK